MTKTKTPTPAKRPARPRRSTIPPRDPAKAKANAEAISRTFGLLTGRTDEHGRTLVTKEALTPTGAIRLVTVHAQVGGREVLREARLHLEKAHAAPEDLVALVTTLGDLLGYDVEKR